MSSGGEGPKEDLESEQEHIDREKYSARFMSNNSDWLVSSTCNWQRQRFHNLLPAACGGGGDDGRSVDAGASGADASCAVGGGSAGGGAGGKCGMSSLCPGRKLCDLLTCQCEHMWNEE